MARPPSSPPPRPRPGSFLYQHPCTGTHTYRHTYTGTYRHTLVQAHTRTGAYTDNRHTLVQTHTRTILADSYGDYSPPPPQKGRVTWRAWRPLATHTVRRGSAWLARLAALLGHALTRPCPSPWRDPSRALIFPPTCL